MQPRRHHLLRSCLGAHLCCRGEIAEGREGGRSSLCLDAMDARVIGYRGQQMRGSCSPESMSTTRVPPTRVFIKT
jgi:hypothetical protein